jgi:acyl carrier protein
MSAMSPDTVRERVRGFIAESFYVPDVDRLSESTSLVESGIVDSTGVLEVIAFIESTFGIAVEDAEAIPANLDSIQNIVTFVARKLGPPPAEGVP